MQYNLGSNEETNRATQPKMKVCTQFHPLRVGQGPVENLDETSMRVGIDCNASGRGTTRLGDRPHLVVRLVAGEVGNLETQWRPSATIRNPG
jgi:hypothetical protein